MMVDCRGREIFFGFILMLVKIIEIENNQKKIEGGNLK